MPIDRILVVDDEPLMRDFIAETLQRKGLEVFIANNGIKALEMLKSHSFDMIITDMRMKEVTGIDLLKKVKEQSPATIVVVITGFGSIENAVEAMRLGAFTYLIKPFAPETIETLVDKARQQLLLVEENSYLRQQVQNFPKEQDGTTPKIIAESPAMKKILEDVQRIAQSQANIFLHGESGTGKEVIAHAIHYNSARRGNPFIKVNCAAVPDTLIEAEFFGHEKGAFTGAINKRTGRFELAHGGTLLLDEVTEIPLLLQSKLLRVIQEHEFERIGGSKPIKVDVRIVSTSNRDMKEALANKSLREDLFFRLNVVPIHLPPLRSRKEDILPLADYFLKKTCRENYKDSECKVLTSASQKKLQEYSWPGNVRELSNVIERAVVMHNGKEIAPEQLFLDSTTNRTETTNESLTFPLGTPLHELERRMIIETLHQQNNNTKATAQLLGITPRKLLSKLSQYSSVSSNL